MRTVCCCVLLALLSACANQSPTDYYTLAAEPEGDAAKALPKGVSVGVGPITLPPMLDRKGIVTHPAGGPQIRVASYDVWAGDLEVSFARVAAERLAQHLNATDVWAAPWDPRLRPEYQLRLFVDKFSGELGGPVTLKLKWVLLADFGKRPIGTWVFQKTDNADTAGYASYVQTLNQLLADFAADAAVKTTDMINGPVIDSAAAEEEPGG